MFYGSFGFSQTTNPTSIQNTLQMANIQSTIQGMQWFFTLPFWIGPKKRRRVLYAAIFLNNHQLLQVQ